MNEEEKYVARCLFKLKTHEFDGKQFEDFFVSILTLHNKNFRPVKPQGSIGDRKNDGFDSQNGIYYQVYAPEDITLKQWKSLDKLKNDFTGLYSYWNKICKIKKFFYVINDKYKGAYPITEKELAELKKKYSGVEFNLFLSKDLEDVFVQLSDQDINSIVGLVPKPDLIENIDYTILTEVVNFITQNSKSFTVEENYDDPKFEKKISFNKLSKKTASFLRIGSYHAHVVDDFFSRNSDFSKKELQKKFRELYEEAIRFYDLESEPDLIFFHIFKKACSRDLKQVQDAIFILIAYYFEACDIFETPIEK